MPLNKPYRQGTYIIDSVHVMAGLFYKTTLAGATIFNGYSVEDVVYKQGRVGGVVGEMSMCAAEGERSAIAE